MFSFKEDNIEQIYDITMNISQDMLVYPGDIPPCITIQQDYSEEGFRVSKLILGSHTGTHVDAPKHFLNDGLTVDKLSLINLIGQARILEVMPGEIKKAQIPNDIKSDEIILFKTKIANEFIKGKENSHGKNTYLHSFSDKTLIPETFLNEESASFLVELGVKTVGIDSLSIEAYDGDGSVHKQLLSNSIIIVEGLNLQKVPPGDYFFICLPLKIKDCDGAPARAMLLKLK